MSSKVELFTYIPIHLRIPIGTKIYIYIYFIDHPCIDEISLTLPPSQLHAGAAGGHSRAVPQRGHLHASRLSVLVLKASAIRPLKINIVQFTEISRPSYQ